MGIDGILYFNEKMQSYLSVEHEAGRKSKPSYNNPFRLLLVTAVSIFVAESVIMIFLSIFPRVTLVQEAITDSLLLLCLMFPVLYIYVFSPLVFNINEREEEKTEKDATIAKLEKAICEINALKGIIPICANCKCVRDDAGYWQQVEVYIRDRSEAEFSHGICPDCARKLYPGLT